ncbi:MAG: hypothetical protein WC894_05035 [Patescibacteria group bacterium]
MGERINKIKSRVSIIMNGDQKPKGNKERIAVVSTVASLTYTADLLIIPIISKILGLDFNLPTQLATIFVPMLLGVGEILRQNNLLFKKSKASKKTK